MDYRTLGRSGLRVSTLTLGTMGFGGGSGFESVGELTADDARRQFDAFLDAGGNFVDTANMYSRGASEEIVGQALDGGRRDRLMVATKVRFPMGDGANDAGLSRHHVIASAEASLKRLQADHIDLFQLHEWDGQTPPEEYLEALDTLVRSGKVRYVGCSNFTAWQLMKCLSTSEARGFQRFVSQQIHYTPQAREAEWELLPAGVDQGVGAMIWSPLGGGLLTGKYTRDERPDSGRGQGREIGPDDEPPVYDEDQLYDVVDALVAVAGEHDVSAAQVTLAWILTRPSVTTLVIAARTEEQLADNLAAATLQLTDEQVARIEQASRPGLPYPLWHQARHAADRLSPADEAVLGPWL